MIFGITRHLVLMEVKDKVCGGYPDYHFTGGKIKEVFPESEYYRSINDGENIKSEIAP